MTDFSLFSRGINFHVVSNAGYSVNILPCRLSIIGVAKGSLHGHDPAFAMDEQVQLEAQEPSMEECHVEPAPDHLVRVNSLEISNLP